MADRLGIETIDREGRVVVLKFRPQANVDPVRLVSLVRQRPDLTLVPPAALRLDLNGVRDLGFGIRAPNPSKRGRKDTRGAPRWWTARGREGEDKPGFTKGQN